MSQKALLQAEDPRIYDEEVRLAIGDTVVGRVNTTNATPTTLLTLPLHASCTTLIRVLVWARRTGGVAGTAEDGAGYVLYGVYKVVASVATAVGGATPTLDFGAEDQAAWDATLAASGQDVLVQVTGAANNNITWVARAHVDRVET